jgi:hypothetical protein
MSLETGESVKFHLLLKFINFPGAEIPDIMCQEKCVYQTVVWCLLFAKPSVRTRHTEWRKSRVKQVEEKGTLSGLNPQWDKSQPTRGHQRESHIGS